MSNLMSAGNGVGSFDQENIMSTANLDIEKDIDIDIDSDLDIDTDVDLDTDIDVDADVDSDVDVEDTLTTVTFEAEAIGNQTLVEVDVVVLSVDNELSSASGVIVAAAD